MLANNAEKLKQKIDLYEEYLKASNKHTVTTNQEETASFLKDISGKVHEQLEKRERQRELWRTMETAYYQEKANAGQYKEAHWRLINNEVTENKEADVLRLQSNDLGLAKMAQGTYHVTCFGDGPVKHKYEGEVVLDGDGNMNQDFQNRVNRITAEPSEVEVKQLNEMMQIVSEQLKTVDVDMTLAQPNGALKQKYDEEVGKIQKTVATLGDKLGNVADESIKEQYQKLSLQVKELYNMTNVEAAPKRTLGG